MADDRDAPTGMFHSAHDGPTTRCGFARAIFGGAAHRGGPSPVLEAIGTADYPTQARRPANSLLSTAWI